MEFQQLVFERRSIRGYKPDPVPRRVLGELNERRGPQGAFKMTMEFDLGSLR